MAFASFDNRNAGAPMAEINMVPLIDVMLVLLVIFIVTAPLLTQAVKLELPKANAQPNVVKAEKVEFAIDASGQRFWNGEPVDRTEAAKRFMDEGKKQPQPEIHLRPTRASRTATSPRRWRTPPRRVSPRWASSATRRHLEPWPRHPNTRPPCRLLTLGRCSKSTHLNQCIASPATSCSLVRSRCRSSTEDRSTACARHRSAS